MANYKAVRERKVREQRNRCCYCQVLMASADDLSSKQRATLEHLYPVGHALRGTAFSLKAACWECNHQRGVWNSPKFLLPPICAKRQLGWFTCDPFWLPDMFRD